jgi:CRISPR-associated protein Cas2
MKYFVVVAYDIESNKRRCQVAKLLEKAGRRVNKSVFECALTAKQLEKLKTDLGKEVNRRGDSILYYQLCRACLEKADSQGHTLPARDIVKVF